MSEMPNNPVNQDSELPPALSSAQYPKMRIGKVEQLTQPKDDNPPPRGDAPLSAAKPAAPVNDILLAIDEDSLETALTDMGYDMPDDPKRRAELLDYVGGHLVNEFYHQVLDEARDMAMEWLDGTIGKRHAKRLARAAELRGEGRARTTARARGMRRGTHDTRVVWPGHTGRGIHTFLFRAGG